MRVASPRELFATRAAACTVGLYAEGALNFQDAPKMRVRGLPTWSPYTSSEFLDVGCPCVADLALQEVAVPPWEQRKRELVFRGGATGQVRDNVRLDLCMMVHPQIDAALTSPNPRLKWEWDDDGWTVTRSPPRFTVPFMPHAEQVHYKMAIAPDGNVGTNRIGSQLMMQQALFLPASYQPQVWFYDHLVPWEHYIPLGPSMTELPHLLDTLPDEQLRRIAHNGRRFYEQRLTRRHHIARFAQLLAELPPPCDAAFHLTADYMLRRYGRMVYMMVLDEGVRLLPVVDTAWRNSWTRPLRFSGGLTLEAARAERGTLWDTRTWWDNWGLVCNWEQSLHTWGASQLPALEAAINEARCGGGVGGSHINAAAARSVLVSEALCAELQ